MVSAVLCRYWPIFLTNWTLVVVCVYMCLVLYTTHRAQQVTVQLLHLEGFAVFDSARLHTTARQSDVGV